MVDLVVDVKMAFTPLNKMNLQITGMQVHRHITAKKICHAAQYIEMKTGIFVMAVVVLTDNDIGNPFVQVINGHSCFWLIFLLCPLVPTFYVGTSGSEAGGLTRG